MLHKTRYLFSSFLALAFAASTAHAQTYIEVKTYGAHPDDGADDIPGIRAAIAALPSSNAVLVFESGTYDLFPLQTLGQPSEPSEPWYMKKWIFKVESKNDIVIDGNGATLLCHEFLPDQAIGASYYHLFYIYACTDIEVRDLTVNMSRLPYTMGSCYNINWFANVTSRSFDVFIDPSFLPQSGNLDTMTIHALINWRNGNPNGRDFFHIQQDPQLANPDFSAALIPGTASDYRITGWPSPPGNTGPGYAMLKNLADPAANPPSKNYPKLQVGDDVVFIHQFFDYITFYFVACTRSFLSNVTVHSWPGMAVNMLRDTDVVIDGLQVVPDPQRPWPISTTSDAIHLANISGSLQVAGCYLEGMLDDGFNSYTDIMPYHGPGTGPGVVIEVKAQRPGWVYPAGTVWEFYDSKMQRLGTQMLTAQSTNLTNPDRHSLTFAGLPVGSIAYLCNLSQHPSSIVLSGTTVKGNRGKGFLLRRDTTVTGCLFDRVSGNGVSVSPLIGIYNEGPGGGNVLIESSTFQSCDRGYGLYDLQEGAVNIMTAFESSGVWTAGAYVSIYGVTLRELTILDSGGAAVAVRSADNVLITDCTFGSSGDLSHLFSTATTPGWGRHAAESLLYFRNAGNISITNNTLIPGSTILYGDRWKIPMYFAYNKSGNSGF